MPGPDPLRSGASMWRQVLPRTPNLPLSGHGQPGHLTPHLVLSAPKGGIEAEAFCMESRHLQKRPGSAP